MVPDMLTSTVPSVALGIAAHPDDLDFGASATLAHWANQGTKVYYLIVTDGSKSTTDSKTTAEQLAKLRQHEQRAAANIVGAEDVFFLNHEDSMLELTIDLKREIVRYIRMLKPEIVLTMDPTMVYSQSTDFINHTDHRVVGLAVLDAVYPLARDRLTFPELEQDGLAPHKTSIVMLVNYESHDCYINVTDTIETKMAALAAHHSQVSDIASAQAKSKAFAQQLGRDVGYEYAEAFLRLDVQED